MVNEKLRKFIEKSKKLKIVQKVSNEIMFLYNTGVDISELEYLSYVRRKEESIAKGD